MKYLSSIIILAVLTVFTVKAQEKKINFSKGTLKICSSKNFKIEGYDGKEVVIKGVHNNKVAVFDDKGVKGVLYSSTKPNVNRATTFPGNTVTTGRNVFFARSNSNRKKGLKRLGKDHENKELGIYFTIEQKNGELIFRDNTEGQFIMMTNERYTIKVPNSLKLNWSTNACGKKGRQSVFYNSKVSSLSNFNGEVEISTSLNNLELTDVTGPVSINSIGGNVTIKFDRKSPQKLYSIYSNNGFIDVTLPSSSSVNIDANGAAIYSNIDFENLHDENVNNLHEMKLKLRSGKVKMKLEAGLGTIYLRKKK